MKARELFCDKYLEEDLSKYIFTDEVIFKGGKWTPESEKYVTRKINWSFYLYIILSVRKCVSLARFLARK